MIKIAVVSDLHCHPSTAKPWGSLLHSDALQFPVNDNPAEALIALIETNSLEADILLTPGDLTNKADRQGLVSAWDYVGRIADKLHVKEKIATVGNHDIDSYLLSSQDPFELTRNLGRGYPLGQNSQLSNFWSRAFTIVDYQSLRVLVLNSVARNFSMEQAKRGMIDDTDLESLEQYLKSLTPQQLQIACVHHHPIQHEDLGLGAHDLMINGDPLVNILLSYDYGMIIHGHEHHPRLSYAAGGSSSVVVFAAGSLAAISEWGGGTNTRNLFHIIEIDETLIEDCGFHGRIISWEFHFKKGWSKPNTQSAAIPAVAGFGCRISPAILAAKIDKIYGLSGERFLEWRKLQRLMPEVCFVIPSDFSALLNELDTKFQLACTFERASDMPELLCKKVG